MAIDPAILVAMGAVEATGRMSAGEFSARDYAEALLARVEQVEPQVQAWAHLDRAHVLSQAEAADEGHQLGEPDAALFGIPVGVKDIIDTADLPTENGTVLHAGRQPRTDAYVVRALRAAGALVMGKTVTTELATYAPGKTRNPHHPGHTPGGSSSGSAAAVAAGMVPLAIGTQTNGSVIRPASFCGVVGYKPSAGLIPRSGVLTQSPPLDAVGVFGRSVEDVALLAQVLAGHDAADPATRLRAMPPLLRTASSDPALPPTLAWVATPFWERVEPDARAAFDELRSLLEGRIAPFELPGSAADAIGWQKLVMEADLAGSFAAEYENGREQLSASLRAQIERGRQVTAVDYRRTLERVPVLNEAFDTVFDSFDAIVTPATLGTAPAGLEATGDPIMCTLWTFLGLPCLSLPLLHGANGLPIGVQIVGRRGDDARLLRTARWLVRTVQDACA
ncbi:amidase [uncultured Piscinibacter sp.]|uniref:amidase n=1 Tax=uncultured Piscinibacter sp. TaxID=1131835 RepID=UPI00261358B2|nr:amidase [uncultured Piscinibacter sp.]